ncbi:hypothetical protein Enr10x_31570 [Gimesia panareensis]|uniref:Uncharacterized protein n=1 Tax=Gimesia panareensis TaxID=2527978 RepID=A0A517Q871_9PLAN|nr:hypothetical protein [Gimesia panareensis]QDT27823.1 hypothetical protein Enr10x_31570 [Gimesia panareensis]
MTTSTPRKYLSKDEQTVVVRLIKKMIGLGRYTSEIKTAIAAEYGFSRHSVTRYVNRARREMREFVEQDVDLHRVESYYFYRSVFDNPDSTQHERLRARERIDKIMGIELPNQFHQNKKFNKSLEEIQNMSNEELDHHYEKLIKQHS